jgi:uroporphyrinogen decarboxylase
MNDRQRIRAILNYAPYDRMPVVHFGFWQETLQRWQREGHLTAEQIAGVDDGNPQERAIAAKLGFDFNWYTTFQSNARFGLLFPPFERTVLEELPGGMLKLLNEDGVIVLEKPGIRSIPPEVDHLLKDRKSWEEHFLPRLQFSDDRIDVQALRELAAAPRREEVLGVYCTSLFGHLRGWMGLEGVSYLLADDEPLYDEIIETVGQLAYRTTERILSIYADFDFGHFWEDICFRSGPLVRPKVFETKVGPHYRRITKLVNSYGINIVSLDCDGKIDALIPAWLNNGVNTMFPIEVGTWNASIRPWRETYGRELRGVGGMRKHVFAEDRAAVDAEIERLKPLVDLGGFIPCPDHRIAPDAEWQHVRYYCDRMRAAFG